MFSNFKKLLIAGDYFGPNFPCQTSIGLHCTLGRALNLHHCSVYTGMIGYGLAKAAVHQLVSSLSEENSGLPANVTVLGILP